MALLAKFSETAVVYVVDFVTADTSAAQRYFSRHGFVVTAFASEAFVRTIELIRSLFVVIEAPCFPRGGVMASFATRSQFVFMFIVFFMTGNTSNARVLESGSYVTLLALHSRMLTEEGKTRQIMIDLAVFPIAFVMTAFAFLAFLSLVLVVFFVASKTSAG